MELQGTTLRMKELSVYLYNWAKGKCAEEILIDERIIKAKESTIRLFIAGKMAYAESIYEKSEQAISSLQRTVEGLRTIMSSNKELIKQQVWQEKQT